MAMQGPERARRGLIASWLGRPMPFALVAGCFGLLLWARLILVTDHPRTAVAEPDHGAQLDRAEEDREPDREHDPDDAAPGSR